MIPAEINVPMDQAKQEIRVAFDGKLPRSIQERFVRMERKLMQMGRMWEEQNKFLEEELAKHGKVYIFGQGVTGAAGQKED